MAKTNLENAQSLLTKIDTYARLWRFTCTLVQQPTWYESPLMRNTMFSQPQTLNESSAQQWAQATAQRRSRAWGHRLTSPRLRLGRFAQVTNGQGPNGLHEPRATSHELDLNILRWCQCRAGSASLSSREDSCALRWSRASFNISPR